MQEIYPRTGKAFTIGITGPTGTGKSTLVDKTIEEYRKRGQSVGVLAIDPSSPFTGGALLGDRLRMMDHSLEREVYIRSMASRGDVGGLARAARNTIRVLDAAGMDVVIVETVGKFEKCLGENGLREERMRQRLEAELVEAAFSDFYSETVSRLKGEKSWRQLLGQVSRKELDPETAAGKLVKIIAGLDASPNA